ncbi:MAG: hypothetical protein Q8M02_10210 [Candidatus Didemnitutus sp.]|nr:hypothetical protein [Candidatus Didemnitutus sp.]
MPSIIPSIGRLVHFTLNDGPSAGQIRPAIITNVHAGESPANESTLVDLQVFLNGDGQTAAGDHAGPLVWKTSVAQGDSVGQWHYPVPSQAAHAVPKKV